MPLSLLRHFRTGLDFWGFQSERVVGVRQFDNGISTSTFYCHRCNFIFVISIIKGSLPSELGAQTVCISLFARNAILLSQVFSCDCHLTSCVWVVETFSERIGELSVSSLKPLRDPLQRVEPVTCFLLHQRAPWSLHQVLNVERRIGIQIPSHKDD